MKLLPYILLLFSFTICQSQHVEFISGVSLNSFYNKVESPRQNSSYVNQHGPFLAVAFEGKKTSITNWRITIGFENYGGSISAYDGGNGGGTRVEADINRSSLLVGLYPLNLRLWNKIRINLGMELAKVVYDGFEGTSKTSVVFSGTNTITDLHDLHTTFNQDSFGVGVGMNYDIQLSNQLFIVPHYTFYQGITGEFKNTPTEPKSRRHRVCIAIRKKLM